MSSSRSRLTVPNRRLARPTRRQLLQFTGLGATAGLLAACGPSIGGDDGGDEDPADEIDWASIEPASEITWWSNHPGNTKDLEASYIEAFNEEYPEITINHVTAGAGYDEIAQRFQAASGTEEIPDLVIASDVWWFRYFVNGQIMPIDGVFEFLGVDTSDYVETLFSDYEYEGRHYAAPYARSTPLFYYNRDIWSAAGLPDRGPETWEELQEWAPAIKEHVPGDGAALALSIGPSWSGWWFSNVIWGQGGAMSDEWTVTLDTDEAIAAGEFVVEMYNGENAFAGFGSDTNADFQTEIFASLIGSTGSLTGHLEAADFEVGTSFLPNGPVDVENVPTGGTGLAISSSRTPEQQLAAAMFLKFITETENTATFSQETGYMPVRTSAIEGETMAAVYEETPQFRTSVDQLQQKTRVQDWVRVFTPGGDQIITDGIEELVLGGATPEDVFPQVTTQLDRAFEDNVEPYL